MSEAIALGAFVSEFTKGFPALETPADINIAELEGEGGDPFYVTLPVIPEIGAVSGNGLLYDDYLASTIEEQINAKRPGANFGHLAGDQRETAFPHPKAFWVAAQRVGNTLWAKAYVPVGEARQHLRNLKAMGGKIATSIFGQGDFAEVKTGVRRLSNFALETIDFAPPERAALGYGAPVMVTSEMAEPGIHEEQIMDNAQVIEQLAAVKVPPNKGWRAPKQAVQETQAAPATQEVTEMAAIREALGVPEGMSVTEMVSELREQLQVLTQERIKTRVSEMVEEGVKLPNARGLVTRLVFATQPTTVEEAEEAYNAVMEMQELKDILALGARASMGPAAVVGGKVQSTRPKLDLSPEAAKAVIDRMGINI